MFLVAKIYDDYFHKGIYAVSLEFNPIPSECIYIGSNKKAAEDIARIINTSLNKHFK